LSAQKLSDFTAWRYINTMENSVYRKLKGDGDVNLQTQLTMVFKL